MLSIIATIECPRCKGEAIEHDSYYEGERNIACKYCRYSHSEKHLITELVKELEIKEENHYGVACIHKKDGSSHYFMYEQWMVQAAIEQFITHLEMPDTEPNRSFFVMYKYSTFFVSYGKVPENFLEIYVQLLRTHKPPKSYIKRLKVKPCIKNKNYWNPETSC